MTTTAWEVRRVGWEGSLKPEFWASMSMQSELKTINLNKVHSSTCRCLLQLDSLTLAIDDCGHLSRVPAPFTSQGLLLTVS